MGIAPKKRFLQLVEPTIRANALETRSKAFESKDNSPDTSAPVESHTRLLRRFYGHSENYAASRPLDNGQNAAIVAYHSRLSERGGRIYAHFLTRFSGALFSTQQTDAESGIGQSCKRKLFNNDQKRMRATSNKERKSIPKFKSEIYLKR